MSSGDAKSTRSEKLKAEDLLYADLFHTGEGKVKAIAIGVAVLLLRTEDPCRARPYLDRCVEAAGMDANTTRCRQLLQQIETSCPA
jgi:hypothetical protein